MILLVLYRWRRLAVLSYRYGFSGKMSMPRNGRTWVFPWVDELSSVFVIVDRYRPT